MFAHIARARVNLRRVTGIISCVLNCVLSLSHRAFAVTAAPLKLAANLIFGATNTSVSPSVTPNHRLRVQGHKDVVSVMRVVSPYQEAIAGSGDQG